MTLHERRLDGGGAQAPEHGDLVHGWLGAREVTVLATAAGGHPAELLARVEGGDRCFGTWRAGRIVAARWVSSGVAYVPFLRSGIRLAPGDAWVWDSWTDPSLRGTGIAPAASAALAEALSREGVLRLLAGIMVGNRPGRAAVVASGYEPLGLMASVGHGPSRRVRFRARRQA